MEPVSFTAYSVALSGPHTADPVVTVDSIVAVADARALAHALAWERTRRYLAPAAETADEVLSLRELVVVIDAVEAAADAGGGPLHLTQPQVILLVQAAAMYVAERDVEEYIAPPERERIARLRTLSDRLMGVASEMAAALEQRRHHLPH